MQRWTRRAAAAATALMVATGSVGCSDDDAGRLLTQIFINLLGDGQYDSVSVTIDPADLGTFIDTTTCDLAGALQGCDIDVQAADLVAATDNGIGPSITLPDGPVTVTIDNCPNPIEAFSSLANCLTTEAAGNLDELFIGTGVCSAGSTCDTTPQICVTTGGANDFCGVTPPTTSTSTSSTSSTSGPGSTTTTTVAATTTTTIGGPQTSCVVTWGVINDVGLVGALSYDSSYNATLGGFDGAGASVDCTGIVGQLVTFNNDVGNDTLITAMIDTGGFATPTDSSRCTWLVAPGQRNPVPGDFSVVVTDAADPGTNPIAGIQVDVNDITCTGVTTTTVGGGSSTSTSTSTSTSQSTTTTGGATTTTVGGGGGLFDVFFDIAEAAQVGALQYETDYATTAGQFEGSGQTVDCEVLVDIGLGFPAFNNCDTPGGCPGGLAEDTLVVAITSVSGFNTTGGDEIVRCTYNSPGAPPTPGDFGVTVIDASQPDLTPIAVTIGISRIVPQAP